MLENPFWISFFKTLRPSYTLPTRYHLSNTLLNEEEARIRKFTNKLIGEASSLAIMSDGWSNIRSESIVNFIVTAPQPIFVKSLETKAERHTGKII